MPFFSEPHFTATINFQFPDSPFSDNHPETMPHASTEARRILLSVSAAPQAVYLTSFAGGSEIIRPDFRFLAGDEIEILISRQRFVAVTFSEI
jgi:hypothetical protein